MVLLGVILVLLAAAAGVVLVAATAQLTDSVQIDVLGGTLAIPPLTLLITGMIVISVFWLGWALLRSGLRRSKRRRVEAKEAAAAREAERAEEQRRMKEEFAAREQALTEERRRREEAEALVTDRQRSGSDGAAVSGGSQHPSGSANDTSQPPSDARTQHGDRQV
jgi:type VI protein secretion system component VasK